MHFLILAAGTNNPSNSAFLATTFGDELSSRGNEVTTIRLNDLEIGHFSLESYEQDHAHEDDLLRVRDAIDAADGVVIATPIWNFGVPAHLKNLIDRLGAFFLDAETHSKGQLDGKPFFFLFTGGAPAPAWKGMLRRTTSSLSEGLRYFGASPVGTFFEGKCTLGRGKFGLVVDKRPETLALVRKKSVEFTEIVETYKKTGKAPLKQRIVYKCMKVGERMMKKVF